jgi:hypothetical protein
MKTEKNSTIRVFGTIFGTPLRTTLSGLGCGLSGSVGRFGLRRVILRLRLLSMDQKMPLNLPRYMFRRANGSFRYKRNVPKDLRTVIPKATVYRQLGNTYQDALWALPKVHAEIEALFDLERRTTDEQRARELVRERLGERHKSMFIEGAVDPEWPEFDDFQELAEDVDALSSSNNVAFDIDGSANVNGTTLRTKGTFFGQQGNAEGTQRRLVFGDFDVQHDGDTGSSTATITGRIAWEQMTSNDTMLGYFIGGELAHSNIAGSFEGDQNRLGVTAGGYVVHQLNEQVFLDGFITLGAGRNNLEMANDVLALESDYTTQTATVGAELSGVYEYGQYEFHPELAFSYGKTWMGDVGFTGRAYGLVDNTLSLDAANVSIANLTLRPEIVWALDAETVADSNSQLSFAPRLICERTIAAATIQDCGAGAEIGLMSQSEDGLSSANIRFVVDRVGNSNRSSVVLNLEQRF